MEKGTIVLRRLEEFICMNLYEGDHFDTVRFRILEGVFSFFSAFELEVGPTFEVIKTGFCLFKCSATLSIFLHRISSLLSGCFWLLAHFIFCSDASIFVLSAADNALRLARDPLRPSFSGVKKITDIGRFDPGVAVRLLFGWTGLLPM